MDFRRVRRPNLTVGTIDHGLSTLPGRKIGSYPASTVRNLAMRKNCAEFGVRLFDVDDPNHGIVHVVGPHIGFAAHMSVAIPTPPAAAALAPGPGA